MVSATYSIITLIQYYTALWVELRALINITHGVLCFVKNSLGAKTQHRF